MTLRRVGARVLLALTASLIAGLVVSATPASATPTHRSSRLGTTAVTTAPGIAGTLLKAGILPLPVPGTDFRLGFSRGLNVTYGFPITSSTADLSGPSGDILHSGGINFIGLRGGKLEIGKFDIDLAAGKIFATQVNFAPGRIPVLALDLSGLKVAQKNGATVLSGISLKLTPEAAGALNATFRIALPTDGSLVFGSAVVTLKG